MATLFYTPKPASFQTGSRARKLRASASAEQPAAGITVSDHGRTEGSRTFRNALFNSDSRLQFGHAELFLSDSNGDYSGNTLRGYNREFAALPSGSFFHCCV
jgi:hypothetical protein